MKKPMPKRYDASELAEMSRLMTEEFVRSRAENERLLSEQYHEAFAEALDLANKALEGTDDLRSLASERGKSLLVSGYLGILRNMNRPTVSEDDFVTLSGVGTKAPSRFEDEELSQAALAYLARNLNRDLFTWLDEEREPTSEERRASAIAVAALTAEQKIKTSKRNSASKAQEEAVLDALVSRCHLRKVGGRAFDLIVDGPGRGEAFGSEAIVAGSKADIVVGLHDGRILCLECKVSNSRVNSVKRLNHEIGDKAKSWSRAFGEQCVTGAVIQGLFAAKNLGDAQDEGIYLFCSSDLGPLVDFINETKSS